MSASLQLRCTNCNNRFQPAVGVCPVCAVSDRWEPCVLETTPGPDVPNLYRHPSGVAFFAYDEAARAGADVPAFAAAVLVPAGSLADNATKMTERIVAAIGSNSTFLALASPTNAQNAAQLKSLTRQVQALLRQRLGRLESLD